MLKYLRIDHSNFKNYKNNKVHFRENFAWKLNNNK